MSRFELYRRGPPPGYSPAGVPSSNISNETQKKDITKRSEFPPFPPAPETLPKKRSPRISPKPPSVTPPESNIEPKKKTPSPRKSPKKRTPRKSPNREIPPILNREIPQRPNRDIPQLLAPAKPRSIPKSFPSSTQTNVGISAPITPLPDFQNLRISTPITPLQRPPDFQIPVPPVQKKPNPYEMYTGESTTPQISSTRNPQNIFQQPTLLTPNFFASEAPNPILSKPPPQKRSYFNPDAKQQEIKNKITQIVGMIFYLQPLDSWIEKVRPELLLLPDHIQKLIQSLAENVHGAVVDSEGQKVNLQSFPFEPEIFWEGNFLVHLTNLPQFLDDQGDYQEQKEKWNLFSFETLWENIRDKQEQLSKHILPSRNEELIYDFWFDLALKRLTWWQRFGNFTTKQLIEEEVKDTLRIVEKNFQGLSYLSWVLLDQWMTHFFSFRFVPQSKTKTQIKVPPKTKNKTPDIWKQRFEQLEYGLHGTFSLDPFHQTTLIGATSLQVLQNEKTNQLLIVIGSEGTENCVATYQQNSTTNVLTWIIAIIKKYPYFFWEVWYPFSASRSKTQIQALQTKTEPWNELKENKSEFVQIFIDPKKKANIPLKSGQFRQEFSKNHLFEELPFQFRQFTSSWLQIYLIFFAAWKEQRPLEVQNFEEIVGQLSRWKQDGRITKDGYAYLVLSEFIEKIRDPNVREKPKLELNSGETVVHKKLLKPLHLRGAQNPFGMEDEKSKKNPFQDFLDAKIANSPNPTRTYYVYSQAMPTGIELFHTTQDFLKQYFMGEVSHVHRYDKNVTWSTLLDVLSQIVSPFLNFDIFYKFQNRAAVDVSFQPQLEIFQTKKNFPILGGDYIFPVIGPHPQTSTFAFLWTDKIQAEITVDFLTNYVNFKKMEPSESKRSLKLPFWGKSNECLNFNQWTNLSELQKFIEKSSISEELQMQKQDRGVFPTSNGSENTKTSPKVAKKGFLQKLGGLFT